MIAHDTFPSSSWICCKSTCFFIPLAMGSLTFQRSCLHHQPASTNQAPLMRAMPRTHPPSRSLGGDYWYVCRSTNWLQTQIIKQEEQPKYSGPLWAPGWSLGTQCGRVCSLISAFTLCSHTQTHADTGLERCGRSKTATNSNSPRDGVAGLQASAASYQDLLSHTDREGVTDGSWAEVERLRDIQFPPQQPPADPASPQTQFEASPENMYLQMSHTGKDSANFNFGLRTKESNPQFLP